MRKVSIDLLIGLLILSLTALAIVGSSGVLYVGLLYLIRRLTIYLWELGPRWAKSIAFLLVPAVLLIYIIPARTKHSIERFASSKRRSG